MKNTRSLPCGRRKLGFGLSKPKNYLHIVITSLYLIICICRNSDAATRFWLHPLYYLISICGCDKMTLFIYKLYRRRIFTIINNIILDLNFKVKYFNINFFLIVNILPILIFIFTFAPSNNLTTY